jgi:hypothetical protein
MGKAWLAAMDLSTPCPNPEVLLAPGGLEQRGRKPYAPPEKGGSLFRHGWAQAGLSLVLSLGFPPGVERCAGNLARPSRCKYQGLYSGHHLHTILTFPESRVVRPPKRFCFSSVKFQTVTL